MFSPSNPSAVVSPTNTVAFLFVLALHTLTAAAQSLRGDLCNGNPCLPGIDLMGAGFDLKTGQSRGQQIIAFTFPEKPTYVNPFDNDLKYTAPDEAKVTDNTHGEMATTTNVFYTASSYAEELAASVGLSGTDGAFSASAEVKTASQFLADTAEYGSYAETHVKVTLYDVTLLTPTLLKTAPTFQQSIALLPKEYNITTAQQYMQFIKAYGTHYRTAATFGGRGQMLTAVNTEYSSQSSKNSIQAEANLHFAWLQAGGSTSSTEDQSSEEFRSGTSFSTSLAGGNPMKIEQWSEWMQTFYGAPTIITYEIQPLSSLVLNVDPIRAQNLVSATRDYMSSGTSNTTAPCSAEDAMLRKQRIQIKCAQNWRQYPNCRTSLRTYTEKFPGRSITVMSVTSSTCTNPTESCNYDSDAQCCKKVTTGIYAGSCLVTGGDIPSKVPDAPEAASIDTCFTSIGYAVDQGSSPIITHLPTNQTLKAQHIMMVASADFDQIGAIPTNSPGGGKDKRTVALATAVGVAVSVVAMVALVAAWTWRRRRRGSQIIEERQPLDVENVAVTNMQ